MKRTAPQVVVADAGPMIGLAVIGALPWLRTLFGTVLVPDAVAEELRLGSEMPGARALHEASRQGWLKVVPVRDIPQYLHAAVDRGEAAAITLARQMGGSLLIDENRGRIAARSEGVHVFGSGAVLLKAKAQHIIPEIRPHLEALTHAGYRLSLELRRALLKRSGEL